MEILNSIPLFTVRDREQARPVPAPRSMYGTGSSAFPTNQKEMPAETRQAHRRTMEARLRREPEDIKLQVRKTAAIRILPVLHREAHILLMEMLPDTEAIRAVAIPPVEAAIQMAAMVLRMGIIPMLVTEIQVPTTRITKMVLQAAAIRMEAVTWATIHGLRMEEPRKAVLTSQMPLHRMVRLETRCISSKEGMPSMAKHRRKVALPGMDLPTSRKAWPHSFPSLHNFRITRLRSLPAAAAPADHFRKGIACLRLNTAVPFLQNNLNCKIFL